MGNNYGVTYHNGFFAKKQFSLDKKLVKNFESLGTRIPGTVTFLLVATILHEVTHVGYRTGWFRFKNTYDEIEEGEEFEKSAFGEVIYLFNAFDVFVRDRTVLPQFYRTNTSNANLIVGEPEIIQFGDRIINEE